jgi:protein phosphatase
MIRIENAHLKIAAQTHPGMSGKNNEDRFAVSAYKLNESDSTPVLVAVLSDGIGGHRAGEIAAEIAVNQISHIIAGSDVDRPWELIVDAVQSASIAIQQASLEDPDRQGMGATCAVVCVVGNKLYSAAVGDSRIYIMRNNRIQQMTIDHTWIQEAIEAGILNHKEVDGHPNAHVIRRYLGGAQPPVVDQRLRITGNETDSQAEANQGFTIQPGDRLLLCSDGLTDLVSDSEILAEFQKSQTSEAKVSNLIDLANERGGHDNITLITIEGPSITPQPQQPTINKPFPRVLLWILALFVAGGIITAVVWGALWAIDYYSGRSFVETQEVTLLPNTNNDGVTLVTQLPASITPGSFSATVKPLTPEPQELPPMLEGGATLTPWPTNTIPSIQP